MEGSRDSRFEALGFFIVSSVRFVLTRCGDAPEQEQSGAEDTSEASSARRKGKGCESVEKTCQRVRRKREVCKKTSVSVLSKKHF